MKSSKRRAGVAALIAVGLTVGYVVGAPSPVAVAAQLTTPAPVEARNAQTVTSDVLPTAQTENGVVWTTIVIGNTVYAGGSFTAARPAGAEPGVGVVTRTSLLAFDLTTGVLTSFAPTLNGPVKALAASPDGARLYVGGTFTTVNGATRWNFAAFDTATGALSTAFKPAVGGSYVNAIAATSSAVYVGGLIGAGAGVTRKNLTAFDTAGKLLAWAPTTDLQVDAMVLTPSKNKLIIGGRFGKVNGVAQRGLAALDLVDGSILPWIAPTVVQNGWSDAPNAGKAGIYSLSADANAIYGTGWVFADATIGNLEGAFSADPDTGAIKWLEDCHGDTYTSYSDGTNVYMTGHNHDCGSLGGYPQAYPAPGNLRHAIALTAETKGTLARSATVSAIYKDWSGQPAPAMINWFPDWTTGTASGQGQAGWTATGKGDYLVIGGEFPYVNGKRQQGLVRFARPGVSGAKEAPRLSGARWIPTARSLIGGQVTLGIPANWDRDDMTLTYTVTRSGTATPVYTTTRDTNFWTLPGITYVDKGLVPGNTYSYQVTATDPNGNQAKSQTVPVTVSSAAVPDYTNAVLADGAGPYWRLGGTDGSYDLLGVDDAIVGTGVTSAATGALGATGGVGYTTDGTANGLLSTSISPATPSVYSLEGWFRTTTTSGGKLFGFGSAQTGQSSSYDRHVYMTNDGKLVFGAYNGRTDIVTSPKSYNDGQWHHLVAGQGAAGMALYLDGSLVGSNTVTTAQPYSGYWRVGGDNLNGWPSQPASAYFAGDLDEFAVYPTALGPDVVQSHYRLALGAVAPTAAFTSQVTDLSVAVDGSSSVAQAGFSVASYAWDFGDGASGTGATTSHSYAASGTYTVKLTAVDTRGVSGTVTHTVTVRAPHTAPVPVVTATVDGAKVTVDGSASTTSDDATLTFAWDFGDGSAPGSGASATHTYATTGRYTITATLTDSMSFTATTTRKVMVSTTPLPKFTKDVLADGASLYWRLGGTDGALDMLGSNDGVVGSGVTDAAAGALGAEGGSASSFNGSGNGLVAASVSTTPTALFSLEGWFRTTSTTGGKLFGYGNTSSGNSANYDRHVYMTNDGRLIFGVWNGQADTVTSPNSYNDGQWHHVVAAIGSGGMKLYLDGQLAASNGVTTAQPFGGYWRVGGDNLGGWPIQPSSFYFSGDIDEFAVYPQVLSPETIAQHFADAAAATPPSAAFSSHATDLSLAVDASASAAATGATIASYGWDFGDGTTGTGVTATHAYSAGGSYLVKLTVTDSRGATGTSSDVVTVIAPHAAPTAEFSAPVTGLSVAVDATASTVADGATLTYAWNFGDGASTGPGATANHTYAVGGDYTITLVVTDSLGVTATTSHQVTVAHADPSAVFSTETTGLTLAVDASGSAAGDSATLSFAWDFGDGGTATGAKPSHTYTASGTYTVVLVVTDSLGSTATTSHAVTVAHEAPTASFTSSAGGLTVDVDADASAASDGDSLTYAWNWGDGSAASSGKTASHTYATAGDYSITLTVTDDHALTGTRSRTVTASHAKPVAAFTVSTALLVASVDASSTTASDAATLTYSWNWGDASAAGSGKAAQHTYGAAGTYTVTLTATDSLGGVDTTTRSVVVSNPADTTKALADFATDVASGWGTAKTGGAWTTSGSGFLVTQGVGKVTLRPKDTKTATLAGVSALNLSASTEVMLDKVPTGGMVHLNYDVRKTAAGAYRVKTRFNVDGTVNVMIARVIGTTETSLVSRNITGLTYTAGSRLSIALEASTTSGVTTLRAKGWLSQNTEPTAWLVTATSSEAALNVAGAVSVQGYMPSTVTNSPIVMSVDNLKVSSLP